MRPSVQISDVATRVVDDGDRDWVFVRVETDEAGLVGWGEASLGWHTRAVVGAIGDLEPLIVGEDPRAVERLWQAMTRAPFFKAFDRETGETHHGGIQAAILTDQRQPAEATREQAPMSATPTIVLAAEPPEISTAGPNAA